ncbi:PD40 domain-containing protein [Nocardioides sp. SYSU D00038]|uniref:TolB family protein n=1 Tax=Nocardioides sp. SYSU D00038 TaxID=2812554 RepID=UPI001966E894|nr:PD40 domain-containing protein [Nocardioides sp. SYSU D00038]
MRTRPLAAVVATLATAALLLPTAPAAPTAAAEATLPAAGRAAPTAVLTTARTKVTSGPRVGLTARVPQGRPGQRVVLQRQWAGGRWATVAGKRLGSGPRVRFRTPVPIGATRYRAVVAGRRGPALRVTGLPHVGPTRREPGAPLVVSGLVGSGPGRTVRLQGRVAGAWTTLGEGTTTPAGRGLGTVTLRTSGLPLGVRLQAPAAQAGPRRLRAVASPAVGAPPRGTPTSLVSRDNGGAQHDAASLAPSVSGDGRYVAFASNGRLDPAVTGAEPGYVTDVFLRDRWTGTTRQLSRTASGSDDVGVYGGARISADGRYVAFSGFGAELTPQDDAGFENVYLFDRVTGTLRGLGNGLGVDLSANGRWLVFQSGIARDDADDNASYDVFRWDRTAPATAPVRVSRTGAGAAPDGASTRPSVADNGRVAYQSTAPDVVPNDVNGFTDVFLHSPTSLVTTLVSRDSIDGLANGSSEAPDISADGRWVAYSSWATDVSGAYDGNGSPDVLLWDSQDSVAPRSTLVSRNAAGTATAWGESLEASVSANGARVAFTSYAPDLVPGGIDADTTVFVWSRATGTAVAAVDGPDGQAFTPNLSPDGRRVVFAGDLAGLVRGERFDRLDVFLREGL